MAIVGYLVYALLRCNYFVLAQLLRLSRFLACFLPVLLSPSQLAGLVKNHYITSYKQTANSSDWHMWDYDLSPTEAKFFEQYKAQSGKVLVLGSGLGRESIAIARKGAHVVGVDYSYEAVGASQRVAKGLGVPAQFHQADFHKLPYLQESFDVAMLCSTMYSAIPDRSRRQAWLGKLSRVLKSNGAVLLSFSRDLPPVARLESITRRLNPLLARLPGANPAYQPGDGFWGGHFFHVFLNETEVRRELEGAGLDIQELNWAKGYAIATCPPRSS